MSELPLVLDLFSGTGSATQPFVECGKHRVVRVDIAGKPDVRADVSRFHVSGPVQFIWASPPCQGFSVAGIPAHWKGNRPDRVARMSIRLAQATFRVLAEHPEADWIVENPMGLMRKYVPGLTETVFYCSYGERRKKPTDLWESRPFNLARPCAPHEPGPRGSHAPGTTQGYRSGDPRRAMIPRELAEAVHRAVCPKGAPQENPSP